MPYTAADAMVERLIEWDVDTVFGLPGDNINGFMEALRKASDRIRFIHVRHEEMGALAAVGYAKFIGKLGVCFATSGPGAAHRVNGVLDAKMDQSPLLAITGMTQHDLLGTGNMQGTSGDYLFKNLTVYNQRIMGPAHVQTMVDQACRTALAPRGSASAWETRLT
jgi:pyruvate dehydrogenase (quinone)/pyruvate oxidase